MAYELEKNRLASLLTATVGITRQRDNALEREATERAFEASLQTGMNIGSTDGEDLIIHPTATERRARLNVPTSVATAELATWNYLYQDPILRAAQGFLSSAPHRAVLDSAIYDYWGFGIYTKMPEGSTNELLRRWWIIIWLSNVSIGGASMTQPKEIFSPTKYVGFSTGTYKGYQFDYTGKIISTKSLTLSSSSQAAAKGRGTIPGRPGSWLLMANGHFADHWVPERGFVAQAGVSLT